ncbi:uncharacterized protein [Diadema antillarum]|uniref:uncharacterized protein n=1 Tax=Diadema antillarum TaxID=105358 RepID=UPI003A88155E
MDPSFRDNRCPGYYSQEHNPPPQRGHHTQFQSAPRPQHPHHVPHYPQQVPFHPNLLPAAQQAPFMIEHGEVRGQGDFATGHSAQSTLRSIFPGPTPVLPTPNLSLPPRGDEPLNFSPGVQQLTLLQQTTLTCFPPVTNGNRGQSQLRDPGDRVLEPTTNHPQATEREHQDTESPSLRRPFLDSQSTATRSVVSLPQTQGSMVNQAIAPAADTSPTSERRNSPQSSTAQAPVRHGDALRPDDSSASEQNAVVIPDSLASSHYTTLPAYQSSTPPLAQKRALTVLQQVSMPRRSVLVGQTQSEKAGHEHFPLLPDCLSFIYCGEEKENISGVKAKKQIEKGVLFGPYEGDLLDEENGSTKESTWELCLTGKVFLYVDGKGKNHSSALAHIRCARNMEEQNLEAVQVLGDIYFRVTKVIEPGMELMVFYSEEYSDLVGFKTELNDLHCSEGKDNFCCDQCEEELPTAKRMMRHIKFDHEPERVKELCPVVTWRLKGKEKFLKRALESEVAKDGGSKADTTKTTQNDVPPVPTEPKRFACRVCGKRFDLEGRLKAHSMFHEFAKEYTCSICGEKQRNTFMLTRHIATHGERGHKCPKCDKSYKTQGALYRHERDIHGIPVRRNHACRFCSVCFVKKRECVEHEMTHKEFMSNYKGKEKAKPREKRVSKRVLEQREDRGGGKTGLAEEQLDLTVNHTELTADHIELIENHDEMSHTLPEAQCGQSLRTKKKGVPDEPKDMLGKTADYYTKPRPYKCRYCPKRYMESSTALEHEKEIHKGIGTFMCDHCPRVFVSEAKFLEHAKNHEQNRMYRCSLCPRTFASENALNNHQGEHTGLKPFKCELCGRGFRLKNGVYEHKRRMHRTREMRFFCAHCNKGFTNRAGLTAHERRHRGIRPFVCLVCGKGFTVKYSLQNHMRSMHEDKKPFSCNICGKSFSLNQTYTTHMFRHKVLDADLPTQTDAQQPQH